MNKSYNPGHNVLELFVTGLGLSRFATSNLGYDILYNKLGIRVAFNFVQQLDLGKVLGN